MRKIAFHFHNDGVVGVDFKNIEKGNPGVGGTVFLTVLIPTLLARRCNIAPVLLANKECVVPEILNTQVCGDLVGALNYCRVNKDIDAIVVDAKRISIKLMKEYDDINFILWANTFIDLGTLSKVANIPNVVRIINVGSEQNDLYRDMKVFSKSTYIFNIFPLSEIEKYRVQSEPTSKRKNWVVYVASLSPVKGFHILAKAWPKVLEKVPDAELFVIGSGKLYDKNKEMGHWGISTSKYESKFISYITSNGEILPSVHFLGVMGIEKYEVIAQCKVGVPNPTGYTETFGYTAVEMQAMGCHVTTKMCPGYLDTVYDKSCLYKDTNSLSERIVELLESSNDQPYEVVNWIESRFGTETIIRCWEDVLESDLYKEVEPVSVCNKEFNFHNKRLKEMIHLGLWNRMKSVIPPVELFFPSLNGGLKIKILEILQWLKK